MSNLLHTTTDIRQNLAALQALGWSLIPLNGGLMRGAEKAPALRSWAVYMRRKPTPAEYDQWLNHDYFSAYGVVLGRASGVVVVDIDSDEIGDAFRDAFPDLLDTFTVRSGNRGLPHYYYAIGDLTVRGQQTLGIELRGDGQYVVAPNTRINGKVWAVVNGAPPKKLTEADLSRISRFISTIRRKTSENAGNRATAPDSAPVDLTPDLLNRDSVSLGDLRRLYQHLAPRIGRNNALFTCARYGRDVGYGEFQVCDALTPDHVAQPPNGDHPPEAATRRHAEAQRTIRSAFSQAPRPRPAKPRTEPEQLPNSARESLLARGWSNVARMLDGLLLLGVEAGRLLNAPEVYRLLAPHGVGRNAIYAAVRLLKSLPPRTPPSQDANAVKRYADETNQCLFGRVAEPVKNRRGRPHLCFVMPSITALCDALGVPLRGADTIAPDDLRTPAAYRAALHTALIRRAPGQYARHWQARRLNVSPTTCRRYERACGVMATPCYHETPLSQRGVNAALSDTPIWGQFLLTEKGKRYPPRREIARRELRAGRRVSLLSQQPNHYHIADQPAAMPPAPIPATPHPPQSLFHHIAAPPVNSAPTPSVARDQNAPAPALDGAWRGGVIPPRTFRPSTPQGAPEAAPQSANDGMAERLYSALRALDPAHAVTRRTAQKWVEKYGGRLVDWGVRSLQKSVDGGRSIRNPAGYLAVWLRAHAKYRDK